MFDTLVLSASTSRARKGKMTEQTPRSRRLSARFAPLHRIHIRQVKEMYAIFKAHYEHTDLETFMADLSKKDGAILLREPDNGRIVGFSSIVTMPMGERSNLGAGVFSGDTIVMPEYWGSRALHFAFMRYIIRQKLRRPATPLFWLLISKGYKTYLLMANNFDQYYPHPDNRHPELEPLVQSYCERLFPGHYDPEARVLDFGESAQHLRQGVAGITEEMAREVPKIRFFRDRNPTWDRGTELPCIALLTYACIARAISKWWFQSTTKSLGKMGGRLKALGAR